MSLPESHAAPAVLLERAIRLTYAQMTLNAIFAASTGGMFLVGFAMALGADNVLLGWMGALPQFLVVFQLLSAYMIERGMSRKTLTVVFSTIGPLGWFLIAIIPFLAPALGASARVAILIGIISLVALASQFSSNARWSWLGELIPDSRRARFFGYCMLFAGVVGAVFSVIEGKFLDMIQAKGLFAFAALFFVGALFGLVSAALNVPQPDCPLPGGVARTAFIRVLRGALRNRPLGRLALVNAVYSMGNIAAPFGSAYCLRDVGVSYFGLGMLNAVGAIAGLAVAPLSGRLADRFGCRPIMILGLLLLAPSGLVWVLIPPGAAGMAYAWLPWANALGGVGTAAYSVAISSLLFKMTPSEGRSAQFALFSVMVALVSAPMPLLGGWLVSALESKGWGVDLRLTFYLWIGFMALAAWLARHLREPHSLRTRALVFDLFPRAMLRLWESDMWPFMSAIFVFHAPHRRRPHDPPAEP